MLGSEKQNTSSDAGTATKKLVLTKTIRCHLFISRSEEVSKARRNKAKGKDGYRGGPERGVMSCVGRRLPCSRQLEKCNNKCATCNTRQSGGARCQMLRHGLKPPVCGLQLQQVGQQQAAWTERNFTAENQEKIQNRQICREHS